MRTYIKKLQAKPEEVRKQILAGSLVVIMSFVCFIWVSSIGPKFSKEKTAKISEDLKPFALFGQSITDTYTNVTASVGSIKTSLKNEEPVIEEKLEIEKQIDLIPVEYQ